MGKLDIDAVMKIFRRRLNDDPLKKVSLIITPAEREFMLSPAGKDALEDLRVRYGSGVVAKLQQSDGGGPFVMDV